MALANRLSVPIPVGQTRHSSSQKLVKLNLHVERPTPQAQPSVRQVQSRGQQVQARGPRQAAHRDRHRVEGQPVCQDRRRTHAILGALPRSSSVPGFSRFLWPCLAYPVSYGETKRFLRAGAHARVQSAGFAPGSPD